ncbi:hypothetical protein SDC9_170028 [bioreactor metagenome]|uniref:Uncharacterized protein n=1 Tax=bioreactor metagenome TaxID=1076179 RepID=A0A645G7N5_9ZZZZ
MAVLPPAAGLADIFPLRPGAGADGLAVGNLGASHPDVHAEFPLQAVDDDLEVELSHSTDDGLGCLFVSVDFEGRVLFSKGNEPLCQLDLVVFRRRLHGKGDDRLGDEHRGHRVVEVGVAEGVARGAFDAEQRDDVAAGAFADVLHGVRVHADEAADLEALAGPGVVELVALLELALVDADVGELAVLAVLELEAQGDSLLRGGGD